MNRYALVNQETKIVWNVTLWDGNVETWQPPEGYDAVLADKLVEIGDTYSATTRRFTKPTRAPAEPAKSEIEQLIEALVSEGALSAATADELKGKRLNVRSK